MIHRSDFRRIIIEATNHCNLNCSICLRHSWSGHLGSMSEEIFSKFVADLSDFSSPPGVFFGGYGEPLSHPDIAAMISQVTDIGSRAALITNGTLLTLPLMESLVEAGLQKLWISVDSSHQDALIQSQAAANQPNVLDNLTDIKAHDHGTLDKLESGFSLVLTKSNRSQIPELLDLGQKLGHKSFFITNLEAFTSDQAEELPYSLGQLRQPDSWRIANAELIEKITKKFPGVSIDGVLTHYQNKCPFAERGDLVMRWDGEISPCLPLLYDRTTHIENREYNQFAYSLGNILDQSIQEIWSGSDYSIHRERLLNKEFSPCLSCRDCWFSDDNLQDCQGFEHPTCGGCLWAEGLISCP